MPYNRPHRLAQPSAHIVPRGHNGQVVGAATEDFQRYLDDLRELKDVFGVKAQRRRSAGNLAGLTAKRGTARKPRKA